MKRALGRWLLGAAGILAALWMAPFAVWGEEAGGFSGGRIDLLTGEGERFSTRELGCPGAVPVEVIAGEESILDSTRVGGSREDGWVRLRAGQAGVSLALLRVEEAGGQRLVPLAVTSRTVLQVAPEENQSVAPGELGEFVSFLSAQVNPPSPSLEVQLYTRQSTGAQMLRLRGGSQRGVAFLAVELAREDGSTQAFAPWFTPVVVEEGPPVEEDLAYWREIREKILAAQAGATVEADAVQAPKIYASALEALRGSGVTLEVRYFDQTVQVTEENLPPLDTVIYLEFQELKELCNG